MPVTVRRVGVPISERLRRLPAIYAEVRTRYLTNRAGQIVMSMRLNIDESQAPDGSLHLALKHPRGKGHNQDNHPLKDSGALYDSILFLPLVPVDRAWIGPTALSKKGYAYGMPQNFGTDNGHIPRRRFIGLRDTDRTALVSDGADMAREILAELAL